MIRLFQFLIFGHFHKWKIIKTEQIVRGAGNKNGGEADDVVATGYALQCEVCGRLHFRKDWVFMNS